MTKKITHNANGKIRPAMQDLRRPPLSTVPPPTIAEARARLKGLPSTQCSDIRAAYYQASEGLESLTTALKEAIRCGDPAIGGEAAEEYFIASMAKEALGKSLLGEIL